jgi:hypothetical protein
LVWRVALVLIIAFSPAELVAQDVTTGHEEHVQSEAPSNWTWAWDGRVFFGYNYQNRKFTDFWALESQNWFMLSGERPLGAGRFTFKGMASLEPFTMKKLGSPQVFQTGETYHGAPLIDYQHPHDLVMEFGGSWRGEHGGINSVFEADLVGSPALGPTPFMHRASARDNPTAPLTHHYLDATHVTTGVLRGGIGAKGFLVDTSVFRGEEQNENRLNIDQPALDSWSVRGSWRSGPWNLQFSGAHLHEPEPYDPYDMTRLTASIEFDGTWRSKPLAATIAWGENREIHGILDGYLVEWSWQLWPNGSFYGRGEVAAKDILGLGSAHPKGVMHFHPISRVAAGTLGYVRQLPSVGRGRLGIGGDYTFYSTSDDLELPYGSPHSFHVFLRWQPASRMNHEHMH